MNLSKATKKVSCKGMSKKQIENISIELKMDIQRKQEDILKDIRDGLAKDITIERSSDKLQIKEHFMDSGVNFVNCCTNKFVELYESGNTGNFKDKYALLQIRWLEWIKECLICNSVENKAVIPHNISNRQSDAGSTYESGNGSMHVSCEQEIMQTNKTSHSKSPNVKNHENSI